MSSVSFRAVNKQYKDGGPLAVDHLDLDIEDGEFMVLVGPSGCGKSTALRMIAGLEEVSGGELSIGDRVVNDDPPGDRDIAMVFQNYALYPHMTVRENIAFPLTMVKTPKSEVAARTDDAAELLGLTEFLDRLPKALSGGQRQRVAMGRAIVRSPEVFLMDEPLSNLDAKLRVQMRSEIIQLQRRLATTMVYVTHDQIEAMTMGHRVAVMRLGVLQQVASPQDLYHRPANLFVAAFIGSPAMNLLRAELGGDVERPTVTFDGTTLAIAPGAVERYPGVTERFGSEVIVGLRPEHFAMRSDFEVPDDQVMSLHVDLAEAMGPEVHIHSTVGVEPVVVEGAPAAIEDDLLDAQRTPVVARVDGIHVIDQESEVELAVKTHLAHFFDPESGTPLR